MHLKKYQRIIKCENKHTNQISDDKSKPNHCQHHTNHNCYHFDWSIQQKGQETQNSNETQEGKETKRTQSQESQETNERQGDKTSKNKETQGKDRKVKYLQIDQSEFFIFKKKCPNLRR